MTLYYPVEGFFYAGFIPVQLLAIDRWVLPHMYGLLVLCSTANHGNCTRPFPGCVREFCQGNLYHSWTLRLWDAAPSSFQDFFEVSRSCKVVVACRVSPLQKSQLVRHLDCTFWTFWVDLWRILWMYIRSCFPCTSLLNWAKIGWCMLTLQNTASITIALKWIWYLAENK